MATAVEQLVEELDRSYHETHERLNDPGVYADHREAAAIGRKLKELEGAHRLAHEWMQARQDLEAARSDGELVTLVPEYEREVERLEEELKLALLERDPNDAKDVIVEIRQGVGGDEAAIWAADIFRMLSRYAERRGGQWGGPRARPHEGGGVQGFSFL